jgi:hypothetical protein
MNDPSAAGATAEQRDHYIHVPAGQIDDILDDLPGGHSVSEATRNLYRRLIEARRGSPPQNDVLPLVLDDDGQVMHAPMQAVRHAPEHHPRRGLIVRKRDVTGISGVGVIAEFCVFSDGATAIRWLGGPPQHQPKFEFYDNPGIEPFIQISGHNGNTEIVWIDADDEM